MQQPDPAVVAHYESTREEDRLADGMGQLERVRVEMVLSRHLPPPLASVLDVGGATGVHARWLAERGYSVRIVDLSPRHVAVANEELGGLGVVAELGDAGSLRAGDASVDVVLLFGPLYHLLERADRLQALAEARRVVRPGGLVAVGAISRFASLFDGLARGFLFEDDFVPIVERDLSLGEHRNPGDVPHRFTNAYFHHPEELRREVEDAGLEVVELVGLEGLAGWLPQLAERWSNPVERARIVWAAEAIE